MTHFIRQQFIHVDLKGSEAEGFALQHHLSELYYTKLLPVIEKALDACSKPGKHLVIDRLEIDAGSFDLEKIDEQMSASLLESLIKQIEKIALQSTVRGNESITEAPIVQNSDENLLDVFIYFLANGNLPWSYKLPAGKSLEEVLAELFIENAEFDVFQLAERKLANALASPVSARRLVLQFSEPFVIMLLQKMVPDKLNEIESLLNLAENMQLPLHEIKKVRNLVLEKSVLLAGSGENFTREYISKKVLGDLRTETRLFLTVSNAFDDTWLDLNTLKQDISLAQKPVEERLNINDTAEGIYIDNAGLVLLHPFLPRLFEALGISKDDDLIKPEKALSLLHYLVSGETQTPEYELVLPKLLCGLSLAVPIPVDTEITTTETEEATALLAAVIQHWEALRNTSKDELRGNFLLRPGKLSLKDDGDWLLQVESRTYDILLNHLPWGIGMIKLPWMKKMVWVEWGF